VSILLALEPVTPPAARSALERLSPAERERVSAIRKAPRAEAVAVSLALARETVAAATGRPQERLEFTRRCERCGHPTHGRPRLAGSPVELSVSRSERWAAVALAPVAVGADVEDPGRALTAGELDPVLSATERRWAAGRGGDDLLRLWVVKEAVGKAMGVGIVGVEDVSLVEHDDDALDGWRELTDATGRRWSVTPVAQASAVLAVAVAGAPRPIRRPSRSGATCRALP